MIKKKIRIKPESLIIVSRNSILAIKQAEYVRIILNKLYPLCDIKIFSVLTTGDKLSNFYVKKRKNLFIKELEIALLNNSADIAVHSLKDIPTELPCGFCLSVVLKRKDPRDSFVSNKYKSPNFLPPGSVVGTSSIRRSIMFSVRYPWIIVKSLRGNIDSRLYKLSNKDYDAIILSESGINRFGLINNFHIPLNFTDYFLPAIGQGVIAIEIRSNRTDLIRILSPLNHKKTAYAILAERTLLHVLGGSCITPLSAYAQWFNNRLYLRSVLISPTCKYMITSKSYISTPITKNDVLNLGCEVAENMKSKGAIRVMKMFYNCNFF